MRRDRTRRRARRRRGSITLELLLALPILLAVLLATVEFGMLLLAQQQLQGASRDGARVGALGGTEQDVEDAALAVLGNGAFAQAQITADLPDKPGEPVEVVVQIPAVKVVPDVLGFIGISLRDVTISAKTVMRKE
jgi:Flp pilus assembly protein TadG